MTTAICGRALFCIVPANIFNILSIQWKLVLENDNINDKKGKYGTFFIIYISKLFHGLIGITCLRTELKVRLEFFKLEKTCFDETCSSLLYIFNEQLAFLLFVHC